MFFFARTRNPRPTFHLDMTDEERAVMERHVAYLADKPAAIVYGPVADPGGVYGIGIYEVADEAEMRDILENDPARDLLQVEVFSMPRAVVGRVASGRDESAEDGWQLVERATRFVAMVGALSPVKATKADALAWLADYEAASKLRGTPAGHGST